MDEIQLKKGGETQPKKGVRFLGEIHVKKGGEFQLAPSYIIQKG